MTNKERFDKIIMEVFETDAVDETMTRENTEKWNSLLHLTLVSSIEDEFDIQIEDADAENIVTVKDVIDYIKNK